MPGNANKKNKLMTKHEDKELEILFGYLGESLLHDEMRFTPRSVKQMILQGERWWEKNKKKIRSAICSVVYDSDKERVKYDEEIVLVSQIVEVFINERFQVSPYFLALLVVKYGVNKLCNKGGRDGV